MKNPNGWLIYDPVDIPRNQWFIAELIRCAALHNMSLRLVSSAEKLRSDAIFPNTPVLLDATHPDDRPDFIINRSRDAAWSAAWEACGIRVFNRADVTEITNDKYRTYKFFGIKHGIPMAKTLLVTDEIPPLPTPLVKKPLDGHGGEGVAWIPDAAALDAIKRTENRPFLLQEPVVTGWDVRVYVLGGSIYAAVLRTSDCDFRSNFSLGGTVQLFAPDAQMRQLLTEIQNLLPLDFAGVDFLRRSDGNYVLGEIEDAVGCRMLYQLTDKNPAADYIEWIWEMQKSKE